MYKRDSKPDICLFTGFTDFRCGINSLASIIQTSGKDPFSNTLYIFCNRYKDKVKMLYWGGSGFWLLQYRLEKGKFRWLKENGFKNIDYKQLEWLLDGLDIEQKHYVKEVKCDIVI